MVGHPTDYKPEYCDQANKLCKLGATDKELADFFDVVESTVNNWKIAHPEFLESVQAGKEIADMEVAEKLYGGCFDRTIVEQQAFKVKKIIYDDNGKKVSEIEEVEVVDVEKGVIGDFRNQQFWLRNRRSRNWREKIETEHSGQITTTSIDISQLSTEALNELRSAQNTDH